MSNEEVIIRAVCGSRKNFTTFSIVLIRTDSGRQFRLDINGVKGDKLYDDELDLVDLIVEESEKRGCGKRAILRHKYDRPEIKGCWSTKPLIDGLGVNLPQMGADGSIFRVPIPD